MKVFKLLLVIGLWIPPRSEAGQDRYFKEDHLTGATYLCLAAERTYTLIAREHMGVWVTESGRWRQTGETITFVPNERSKKSYQGAIVPHREQRFLTFTSEDASGSVIPPDDTRRQLDAEPGALPPYVFFEIEKAAYRRETGETYPFRTRRLRVIVEPMNKPGSDGIAACVSSG